jgi:DHA2 family multidrug resistance protein
MTAGVADAGGQFKRHVLTNGVNPWLIAAAVMSATFMEVLDTSVANVALPHIAGTLSASNEEATWVLTSYLVSNAIVLPATSWLSGFFGRKRFLVTCIILFTLASLLCGIAASLPMLIGARILQGVGGGALQPISQAVLLESFPKEKRGQAMAVYAMGIVVAPVIGPTLGGWITDNFTWRWVFLINLPVGVIATMMTSTFVSDPPYAQRQKTQAIDYIGLALMIVWIGTLQLVLDKGEQVGWWEATWIKWATVLISAGFVAFVWRELTTDHPVVDLRVFKNRNFLVGTGLIAVVGAALYGTVALLPLFLQTLMGYPALESGMAVSPRGIGAFFGSIVVGRIVAKVDNRMLIAAGFMVLGFGSFQLTRINLEIGFNNIMIPNIVMGVGLAMIFVPLLTVTMGTLRNEQLGNATGIYSLMRNIGGGLGISAVSTLLARGNQVHQNVMVAHLTPYDPQYVEHLNVLSATMTPVVGPANAHGAALGIIYQQLSEQARLASFADCLRLFTWLILICVPLVFLFDLVKNKMAPPGAHLGGDGWGWEDGDAGKAVHDSRARARFTRTVVIVWVELLRKASVWDAWSPRK